MLVVVAVPAHGDDLCKVCVLSVRGQVEKKVESW